MQIAMILSSKKKWVKSKDVMVKKLLVLLVAVLLVVLPGGLQANTTNDYLEFSKLPALPNIGLAGAFAGVTDGKLIVAGGANFPGGRPWDGAEKIWHDDIFVLSSADGEWQKSEVKLPRPLAYGVSVTWQGSVICVGGGDKEKHYSDVFAIRSENGKLSIEELPAMPKPLAFMCGGVVDGVFYVAGGISSPDAVQTEKVFYSLDLKLPNEQLAWETLSAWPGKGKMLATTGVQDGKFYLMGGVDLAADEEMGAVREYLTECFAFDPVSGDWVQTADLPYPVAAAATPAMTVGPSHIMIFGGDDGSNAYKDLRDLHPGFKSDILSYHVITDTWTIAGELSDGTEEKIRPSVTTSSAVWNDNYVVPTGEVRPGVRTPVCYQVGSKTYKGGFCFIDYATIIIYLAALLGVGYFFSKREKGTDDYFKGGGRVPWWAAGLSVFATMLSAITFMAIPAKSYATDWTYYLANISLLVLAPFVVKYYLPFYRRLNVASAYEYLEVRFNVAVRIFGSIAFILFQMGRMAVVLFLPAIALSTVSPIDVYTCILIMGVLCIAYTVMGGIEAVIWTDAIQAIILLFGALLSIIIIVANCDGGLTGLIDVAKESGKLHMVNWSWSYTVPALWVVVIGNILSNLAPYTSDQSVVQRYLTTSDEKKAAKAIWMNAFVSVPASLLFFGVGSALFVFYKSKPDLLVPTLSTDSIYPLFIVKQLPVGIAGLVIAGLFAAAQSTLSSSLNSLSTVIVEDFYKRFKKNTNDHACLKLARFMTLVMGVFGISSALLLATIDVQSLWDVFLKLLGLFGGGLAGLFFLGIFTTRANGQGALVGAIASAIILFAVQKFTDVHFFLYGGIGIVSCVVIGYLASFAFAPKTEVVLDKLTIHSLKE